MADVALRSFVAAALLVGVNVADARLSSNSLPAHKVAASKAAANPLAGSKLAKNTFAANLAGLDDLFATLEGLNLLTFIVSCALPSDVTLLATAPDGSPLEFFGEIGLAKSWLHRPLNRGGRGWVSACVLARSTNSGVLTVLSMRGPHRALRLDLGEVENYTVEEGAFYGDYFVPEENRIACRGKDQAAGESGHLVYRNCTEPDPADSAHTKCGFLYAGDCGDFTPAPVCAQSTGAEHTFYRSCHAQPITKHDASSKFREVITIFLHP